MWILNINYHKTEIVVFNSRNARNYVFKIEEHTVQITNKYKYLGVILSNSDSFLNARKHLAEPAKQAVQLFCFVFYIYKSNNLGINNTI